MQAPLKAPFPWFGGKSRAASLIWERLGNVGNYVEPFAGSLAVLLNRPHAPGIETVNDKDALLCNAWRAIAAHPEETARYADYPCNESDMHARHIWLKAQRETLRGKLEGDPTYSDPHIAGWWLWGVSLWIGGGWCSDTTGGPWQVVDGQLAQQGDAGQGVYRKRMHLGNAGIGVSRKRVQLGGGGGSVGIHTKHAHGNGLLCWFQGLQARLRHVRVCCGDWTRVMGPSVLEHHGLTGVVLDPPYLAIERRDDLYATDDGTIAHAVREWAIAHGDNPLLRIVLCGYDTEHQMPAGWAQVRWIPNGGMGNLGQGRGRVNKERETLWFSPHCLPPEQPRLF